MHVQYSECSGIDKHGDKGGKPGKLSQPKGALMGPTTKCTHWYFLAQRGAR